jgi:hypothetical protein
MTDTRQTRTFVVRWRVRSRLRGTRERFLKRAGKTICFATREEADARARTLTRAMNRPGAKVRFYWVEEIVAD